MLSDVNLYKRGLVSYVSRALKNFGLAFNIAGFKAAIAFASSEIIPRSLALKRVKFHEECFVCY